jgi:predicted  nucleic acid-binding Zn-ribbon protein
MKGAKWHMGINVVSSFAAGVLLASSICGAVYFTGEPAISKAADKPAENEKQQITTKTPLTEVEMKEMLASAGYVVQSKADYDKTLAAAKNAAATAEKNKAGTTQTNSKNIVYRSVITVSQGMTSIDVGKMLEKAKIITDDFKFSQDVEKKGVEKNLRPGTFVVDTGMTYDQVIATIFKK